jgi:3-phosphoshikimate 1-carboxyvinyltransferase
MTLKGRFFPPGDKSISHRLALMAVLADGACRVENLAPGKDVASSLAAAEKLGVGVEARDEGVRLTGAGGRVNSPVDIDCGNSGTTMRLIMGVLAGLEGEFRLTGDESLSRRPMERVAAPLRRMGADVAAEDGCAPIHIRGRPLSGATHDLPVASAQLKSALLLAGLNADGRTLVREPAVSRDHTERMIQSFGGDIGRMDGGWQVSPSRLTPPPHFRVPGDPSSAAFFLCGAAMTPASSVTAAGVLLNPTRIGFLGVLQNMRAQVDIRVLGDDPEPYGQVTVGYSPELTGVSVSALDAPGLIDEVPILALTAARARGRTVFHGVGELRVKESDRLQGVLDLVKAFGGRARAQGDDLIVDGPAEFTAVDFFNGRGDHRLVMAAAVAGAVAGRAPEIGGANAADISYPGFFNDLKALTQ